MLPRILRRGLAVGHHVLVEPPLDELLEGRFLRLWLFFFLDALTARQLLPPHCFIRPRPSLRVLRASSPVSQVIEPEINPPRFLYYSYRHSYWPTASTRSCSRYATRSSFVKRTLPPTLTKGMRRCPCSRRTVGMETVSSFATSATVSSSGTDVESVGIFQGAAQGRLGRRAGLTGTHFIEALQHPQDA